MTDQTNTSGIGKSIGELFSPAVLTSLRYLLTAISPLFAIVGVVALSPQKIDHIINVAQQIGVAAGATMALFAVVAPIAAGAWGTFKSTQGQQVKSATVIATGPKSDMAVAAQTALIAGTSAIAQDLTIPSSSDAKDALIAATIALPQVQTIVTDQTTADASPSPSVVSASGIGKVSSR